VAASAIITFPVNCVHSGRPVTLQFQDRLSLIVGLTPQTLQSGISAPKYAKSCSSGEYLSLQGIRNIAITQGPHLRGSGDPRVKVISVGVRTLTALLRHLQDSVESRARDGRTGQTPPD